MKNIHLHIASAFISFILASSEVSSCGGTLRSFNLLDNMLSRNSLRIYRSFSSKNKDDISIDQKSEKTPLKNTFSNIETYEAGSIDEVYEQVFNITKKFPVINYTHSKKDVPLSIRTMFRGQGNVAWKLHPGSIRKNSDETSALRHLKMIHHSLFNQEPLSINDLSRAQHYGLHTRILDFTGNLLTAIFFAVEESEKDSDKESALHVLDGAALNEFAAMNEEDKGIFTPTSFETLLRLRAVESRTFNQILAYDDVIDSARINNIDLADQCQRLKIAKKLHFPIAVYPNMDNPRVIAQDGRFVLWGGKIYPDFCYKEGETHFHIKPFNFEDKEMEFIESGEKKKASFLHMIKIKNGYKIKNTLEAYGINKPKLYQSVDETTKWLNNIWKK